MGGVGSISFRVLQALEDVSVPSRGAVAGLKFIVTANVGATSRASSQIPFARTPTPPWCGSRRARPGASVHLPVSLLDEPPQVALPLGKPLTLGVGLLCFILKTVYSPMTSAPRRS